MVADVYAGDSEAVSRSGENTWRFRIVADAGPQAFARVVMALSLSNTAPLAVTAIRQAGDALVIDCVLDDINDQAAEYIVRKLRQITDVIEVDRCPVEDLEPASRALKSD